MGLLKVEPPRLPENNDQKLGPPNFPTPFPSGNPITPLNIRISLKKIKRKGSPGKFPKKFPTFPNPLKNLVNPPKI